MKIGKTRHEGEYNNIIQHRKYTVGLEIKKQVVGVEGFFERGSELMFLFCEGFGGGVMGKKKAWFGTRGR